LEGVDDDDGFHDRITGAVQAHGAGLVDDADGCGELRYVCCRLRLTGRTRLHREIGTRLAGAVRELQLHAGTVVARIEAVHAETRPAIDLERLAASTDPPGEVARLLLALEHDLDPPEYRELIERTRIRLADVHRASTYAAVAADRQPDADRVRAELVSQGWRLLDALIAQREGT
jgi:DNA repair protein SbcD/Mre11